MSIKIAQLQTFQLAGSGVSAGDTSMILTNFTQINGTALTMTNFGSIGYGTVEPGSGVNEEQISFTGITANADGTYTLTGIKTVLDVSPYTETSSFASAHAGGVAFVISNTAGFYNKFAIKSNDETITGLYTFPAANIATYDSHPTFTANAQIIDKKYADDLAIAGAPNASTAVQGLVQLATQAQYDAKTLTGSTGAKLVATPDLNRATKYNDYVADTGAANAYVITPAPAITAYATGQQFTFKVTNTNTTASTLAVNGLAATPIKKNVSSALTGAELVANSIVTVIYDGTNFQITSSSANSINGTKLALSAATTTITASGESTISSVSVPANTLGTANAIRVRTYLRLQGNAAETVIIKCKYGSTTLVTGTTFIPVLDYRGFLEFTLFAAGATNSQYGAFLQLLEYETAQASTEPVGAHQANTGTSAEDSTGALTISVTVTFSSTNQTLTVYGSTIEKIF